MDWPPLWKSKLRKGRVTYSQYKLMGKYGELVIAKSCTNLKKPQNTQHGHWVRDITIDENIIVIQSIEQTSPTCTLTLVKNYSSRVSNHAWLWSSFAQWARIARIGSKINNSKYIDFRKKIVKHEIIIYAKSKNCAFFIHNFKGNFPGFFKNFY